MVNISGRRDPRPLPAIEVLRQYFDYDAVLGIVSWKHQTDKRANWNTKYAGRDAGCLTPNGYKQIRLNGKGYRYHRIAWALLHGECPIDHWIDHRNGNKLDNRPRNLRLASISENSRNSKRREGCSLPRGVKRHHRGNLFEAQIRTRPGERISLGMFSSADEAHAAYCAAARKYHGEFARFD